MMGLQFPTIGERLRQGDDSMRSTLRTGILMTAFSLAVLFSAPAAAADVDLNAPLPVDPANRIAKLPNGMEIWVRHHETPPDRVAMWLRVGTGSINEKEDERGIAHFLEHLAFDGSENFSPGELIKFFESMGLTFGHHQNASTSFSETRYILTLPHTDEETVRKGMICLSDFAYRLSLLPDQIEKERGVILEEFRARKGAWERTIEKLLPILLPGSRVADRLPIGKEETVRALTRRQFLDYYKTWYRPDDTVLLVVGDVDPDMVVRVAAAEFGAWPAVENPKPSFDPGIKPYTETRAAVVTDPELTTADVSAIAVRPLEPRKTVGDARADLVDDIGTWILNRRLGELVRAGKAPFQSAQVYKSILWNVATYIDATATGQPDKWEAMEDVLLTELKRAREYGFLEQEMEDARKAIISSAELSAQREATLDAGALLERMDDALVEGRRPMSSAQRLELVRALLPGIGQQEVHEAFDANFQPDARLFLVTAPESGPVPKPDELLAAAQRAEAAPVEALVARERPQSLLEEEPRPGRIVDSEEDPDLQILSVTFANGVRAHLRSMDFKKDTVLAVITLAGGTIRETRGSRGLTEAAALAFQQPATPELSSTAIRDVLTGKNVGVGGGAGQDTVTISINGSPQDIRDGFQLAYLLLTDPIIEKSALSVWKEQALQSLEEARTSVEAQRGEELGRLLSNDDPRFSMLTPDEVEDMTLPSAQRWLNRLLRSAPIEACVVGDIDRDEALDLVRTYLGSLPHRALTDPSLDRLRKIDWQPGPLISEIKVDTITPRASVAVGWRGADWKAVKDRRCLQIIAQILTSRLREEVREKRSLTYTIYCTARAADAYPGTGLIAAYFTADPEKAAEAADLTRNVFDDFVRNGPTDAEMDAVRKQFANIIETSQKEPRYWASVLSDLDYRGTVLNDVEDAQRAYTSYTADDLRNVAGRYIREERRIQVIALPVAKPTEEAGKAEEEAADDG
jgi:zinc protease